MKEYLLHLSPGIGLVLFGFVFKEQIENFNISSWWVFGGGIFFIILGYFSNYSKHKHKKTSTTPINNKAIQSIIKDTYSLYNETSLFVKYCYSEDCGIRMKNLNNRFGSYINTIRGNSILVPQELELKIHRFFDVLDEYRKRCEIIASASKNHNRYKDQQKLEQEFTNKVPPLYSEIEIELRKILTKNPTQHIV